MRARGPGRDELRTKGEHGENASRRHLIDEETKKLQRRRISPVWVFYDKGQWLPGGLGQQPGEQGFQGLLLLALGSQRQGRIAVRMRQRQQGGKQRHCLV